MDRHLLLVLPLLCLGCSDADSPHLWRGSTAPAGTACTHDYQCGRGLLCVRHAAGGECAEVPCVKADWAPNPTCPQGKTCDRVDMICRAECSTDAVCLQASDVFTVCAVERALCVAP